jgi:hypothetical protein
MFERVRARKTEKGVAVFMRAYGTYHFLQEIIEFVNKFYLPPWRCSCVPTVWMHEYWTLWWLMKLA